MTDTLGVRTAKAFLLAAMALCGGPAVAQETELQRCLRIADINDRVACYDAIARAQQADGSASAPLPAAPAAPPSPGAAPIQPDPQREFGRSAAQAEEARSPQTRRLDEIEAIVASTRAVGAGYWQFTTADGSIWRLAETSRSFRPPRPGNEVRIRRGRLGSYYLDFDRQPSMRVVRVD